MELKTFLMIAAGFSVAIIIMIGILISFDYPKENQEWNKTPENDLNEPSE